ncbi:MAG: DUF1905 domain-containing protein, partial [Bacteroidota bacterium]
IKSSTLNAKIQYNFTANIWQHPAEGGWFFVSLPPELTEEIRKNLQWQEEGWGRMKATATVHELEWDTAIWFDKKRATYLLPLKAAIRKKAGLQVDQMISVRVLL